MNAMPAGKKQREENLARMSPQAVMVLVCQGGALAVLLNGPWSLGLTATLAAVYGLRGGSWRHALLLVLLLATGAWGAILSQGLFYGGTPRTVLLVLLPASLFPFGEPAGLYFYYEGVRYGLVLALRFGVIVLLGAGLMLRYGSDEMAAGLRAWRLPAPLCLLLAMYLRFFPLLWAETQSIWRVQHLRGYSLWAALGAALRLPPWRRIRPAPPSPVLSPVLSPVQVLGLPLLAAQVRKADEIAAALHSRGFSPLGAQAARALPRPRAASPREHLLCCGGALLLGLLILAKLLAGHAGLLGRDCPPCGEVLNWLSEKVLPHV